MVTNLTNGVFRYFHNKHTLIFIMIIGLMATMCGCSHTDTLKNNHDYHTAIYEKNNIKIEYPQLDCDSKSINQQLYNAALSVIKYYDICSGQNSDELLDITYSVETLNNDLMSVVFEGNGQVNETFDRVNRFKYSINIDMETGKKLRLSDLTKIDNNLIQNFRNEINASLSETLNSYFDRQSDAELLEYILSADTLDADTYIANQKDVFSYVSNYDIYIIYPLPYAAGDYTTILIGKIK